MPAGQRRRARVPRRAPDVRRPRRPDRDPRQRRGSRCPGLAGDHDRRAEAPRPRATSRARGRRPRARHRRRRRPHRAAGRAQRGGPPRRSVPRPPARRVFGGVLEELPLRRRSRRRLQRQRHESRPLRGGGGAGRVGVAGLRGHERRRHPLPTRPPSPTTSCAARPSPSAPLRRARRRPHHRRGEPRRRSPRTRDGRGSPSSSRPQATAPTSPASPRATTSTACRGSTAWRRGRRSSRSRSPTTRAGDLHHRLDDPRDGVRRAVRGGAPVAAGDEHVVRDRQRDRGRRRDGLAGGRLPAPAPRRGLRHQRRQRRTRHLDDGPPRLGRSSRSRSARSIPRRSPGCSSARGATCSGTGAPVGASCRSPTS